MPSSLSDALNLLHSARSMIAHAKDDLAQVYAGQDAAQAAAELELELRDLLRVSLGAPESEVAQILSAARSEDPQTRMDGLLDIAATFVVMLSNGFISAPADR